MNIDLRPAFPALILAITLSMVTSVNVGVVSLAMAWIVGVYMGGMPVAKVIGAFPIDLLINLIGVTLLFGMANNNGTLGRIASRAVRACKGSAGVIPIMFFLIAVTLSSIGPGNIATTAILARWRWRCFRGPIQAVNVADGRNGAHAGALSRFAPTGIIVNQSRSQIGLGGPRLRHTSTPARALVSVVAISYRGWVIHATRPARPRWRIRRRGARERYGGRTSRRDRHG